MSTAYKLAVIVPNPNNPHEEFLVHRQPRPPRFDDEEYDSYVDSDLWDLPSNDLKPIDGDSAAVSEIEVVGAELCAESVDLGKFDLGLALNQVSERIGLKGGVKGPVRVVKYVEEPEFGPTPTIHTVFIVGGFDVTVGVQADQYAKGYRWVTKKSCLDWLLDVKPRSDRMGPLVVIGVLNDSIESGKEGLRKTMSYQEYPPGVTLVPMRSRTGKPFYTTNLVVFASEAGQNNGNCGACVASGEALVVDPGCLPEVHEKLEEIISTLPRKLIVFLTHHHHDHVDGLSVVQKCNPDAILLAHENTMRRVGRGDWSLGYTLVAGDEEICVGGERLRVIFAPGHTDGHMGLLHIRTHSLIVGDHCVGQGSAVLDASSGGNMAEYFQTTYKFMELSPHTVIPMHGRINLWPKHMLCGYLKNRRNREASVLRAIENGARTLYDIVATIYADVDRSVWIFASSNVKLHVEHLALQNKLPKDFPLQRFRRTWRCLFLIKWLWDFLRSRTLSKVAKLARHELLAAAAVACLAALYCAKFVPSSEKNLKL
ncbi:hypothetical protein Droror1_Dr00022683 [Drosera rotundifolia]